jgi:ABC-type sugar transport system permease subunit
MKSQYTGTATDQFLCGLRQRPLGRWPVHLRSESLTAWGFLAPAVLLLALLAVYPLASSIYLSMTTTQVGVIGRFVGAQHFEQLLHTEIFALTLSNTIWYTVPAAGAELAPGLVLAVVLVNGWSGLPCFAINFLAGLVTTPRDLYEAATVDGARPLARFRIPNMFARAVQSTSNTDAVAFAVRALSDIGYSQ